LRDSACLRPDLEALARVQHGVELLRPQRTKEDPLAFESDHATTIAKHREP
jgi:hypothetical protein